jgi:hypothetical protein
VFAQLAEQPVGLGEVLRIPGRLPKDEAALQFFVMRDVRVVLGEYPDRGAVIGPGDVGHPGGGQLVRSLEILFSRDLHGLAEHGESRLGISRLGAYAT